MSKSRSDYEVYTPELIAQLKALTKGLPRAEGVKKVGEELELSERQARAVYATYVDDAIFNLIKSNAGAKADNRDKVRAKDVGIQGRPLRRLFWDIETSPNIGLFWRAGFKLNIDCDNIIKERAIICIGFKWEGEKDAHILTWDENQDDKQMLEEFLAIANQADEMVHHNGDKFDLPWFKTRCLFHGLIPLPDYKCADTLQWARRKFYFNSNKLNYIAKYLGLGGKIKTEFGLWKEIVLNKNPKSMKLMCDYCKRDVILLEEVWARLSQVVSVKTHAGVLAGGPKWSCPHDGSLNVAVSKTKVTANGTVQYQMRCGDCGRYYTINAAAHAAYLEEKSKKD